MIPYGRQNITQEDIDAVVAVLKSDFLTQGPAVQRFEQTVAKRVGAARAVAVNSATSALHIACAALGVGQGDRLWTTPNSFVASANCGLYVGATLDFVDTDPAYHTMSPDALALKLTKAAKDNTLPKAIVVVHMCGQPADMAAIAAVCAPYGIRIIEDASHAIGAMDQGVAVGAGAHSNITVFSFHPVKIVTSGEGGMAVTQDHALADRMERLRSHGITRDPKLMDEPTHGPWYYQQIELGWNYRITDIQAALGVSQMDRLDAFLNRRHALAQRYDALLPGLGVAPPAQRPGTRSSLHLYPIMVDSAQRKAVFEGLRNRGIGVQVHYIPIHLQPYYRRMGFGPGYCPVAEATYARWISLPMYADLTDDQQDRVLEALQASIADA
jgi:UDP-4-amino-4,6-dideoxy-N-acetyl-beta-L-altrosamine transaminase